MILVVKKFLARARRAQKISLKFYNTLGRTLQPFTLPPHVRTVRMYNCGPTVYGTQHIGNLSMFVFTDVLRRTLEYAGFPVKQVINITDFGHLVSDADQGEDKMTKGLKREGLALTMENMTTMAERYTRIFLEDLRRLNIDISRIEFPRASAYVPVQIAMIQTLIEKSYAYQAAGGVYYDTSRFPEYGILGSPSTKDNEDKSIPRVAFNPEKHNPSDFLLWKSDDTMGWESPWGKGFPGWHIECSAMARALLGEQIDIHTGGIEHIPIHHNNEIAQSEAATGKKPFSRFWIHRAHIQIDGGKIAKSDGNVVYLSEVIERGFHPTALRYLFLGAHYRTNANFSWESLAASQTALLRLFALRLSIKDDPAQAPSTWMKKFRERIEDDVDTPGALAVLWEMTKDTALAQGELLAGLLEMDKIFGLTLDDPDNDLRIRASVLIKNPIALESLSSEIRTLIDERQQARADHRFDHADTLRTQIEKLGFTLEDANGEVRVFKI